MLFDLRARGRRRTVQAVYLALAILFGLGFVGFGVGGGFGGGGIFEGLLGSKEGSSSASYASQISAAEKGTRKNPTEAAGWAALANAQLHEANGAEFYEPTSGKFTSAGLTLLAHVAHSWERYLELKPPTPNVELAERMVNVLGSEGLNRPESAVEALQIEIAARPPNATLYADLAMLSYQAKNPGQGDLASKKAVSLTPAPQRSQLRARLAAIKKNPTGSASGEASTATAGGQTYQVNTGSTATSTGTATVPAPAKKK